MIPFDQLVATVLEVGPEEISDDAVGTHGRAWTSKQHIQLIVALEENYAVSFTHDEIRDLRSVRSVRENLQRKGILI